MEAESFGIPVLATDVGGVGEIVGKLNGVLLPRTITKEELAEALYYALTMDEKRYSEMSIESRRAWEQLSSAETNYTRWATRLASM